MLSKLSIVLLEPISKIRLSLRGIPTCRETEANSYEIKQKERLLHQKTCRPSGRRLVPKGLLWSNDRFWFLRPLLVLSFSCFTLALGGETVNPQNLFLAALQNADSVTRTNMVQLNEKETEARRSTALIYSCIMPGSGQTMFGHTYKGVGFTIAAFGSALTAAISHNNFIARNERLDALEYQYSIATNWLSADQIYKDMIGVQKKLVQDRNRRNIFLAISAVVWTVNIVDFLYNTDDMGQTLFSTHSNTRENQIAVVDSPHNPLFSFSIPLQ